LQATLNVMLGSFLTSEDKIAKQSQSQLSKASEPGAIQSNNDAPRKVSTSNKSALFDCQDRPFYRLKKLPKKTFSAGKYAYFAG